MSEISIEISGICKNYKLFGNPTERLKEALNIFGKKYHVDFNALTDVSLEIYKGETFALVGRNGAGKSTLLKILAGVVSPTSGVVKIKGKIVALLELGSGFNSEMTGHENIFLFGALHGHTREQMHEKYDSIVAFADIGTFIHQPVRTYSTGMFVRLAFACSINLEPDVLIVDEALSVGDARFQQKCFKKIDDLKSKGTTIVLVTHDLSLVKMVSDRAGLIDCGKILAVGLPKDIGNKYFELTFPKLEQSYLTQSMEPDVSPLGSIGETSNNATIVPGPMSFGAGGCQISQISISSSANFPMVEGNDELSITVDAVWDPEKLNEVRMRESYHDNVILGVSISDRFGNYIFGMTTVDKGVLISIGAKRASVCFKVTMPYLKSDDYLMNASVALGTQEHHASLCWYEAVCILNIRFSLRYIYGLIYQNYSADLIKLEGEL